MGVGGDWGMGEGACGCCLENGLSVVVFISVSFVLMKVLHVVVVNTLSSSSSSPLSLRSQSVKVSNDAIRLNKIF